ERRRAGGFVRHCHGDLHLRNICLIDGQPTLFDAIEFNDRIACIDTLYDLAFLLADLEHRDLRALANAALNRYLDTTADCAGLALMPLYLAGRAGIRAQTLAAGAAAQSTAVARDRLVAEARENLALGLRFADPPPPRLIAAGGLSGSGKSTLAYALAPAVGSAPGAVVLRTDVIRKQLAGIAPTGRLPPESYTKEESARVYAALMARATDILASGYAVIADAVFADPAERAAIEACARAAGVGFAGIWLDAPPPVLAARVSTRVKDASDATADVVRMQAALDIGRLDWTKVAASGTPAAVHTAATYALGLAGRRVEAD
ncbi:MAG: AAA family ATPase, partial [Rhodospirillales bacterium]|nr:AAA family ATPase [Rhodospirillales bacterium]